MAGSRASPRAVRGKALPKFETPATNGLGKIITASPAVSGDQLYYRIAWHVCCIGEDAGR